MEEKIVGNKKEGSSFSRSLSLSCIYLISHLSIYLLSLPTIYHPTLVHRQHRILCSLWTSNTRLASPILTEDTSGMVRSLTDDDEGTAPLPSKPIRRVVTVGSIPNTDEKFIEWCGYQTMKRGPLEMMKLYVNQLNVGEQVLYERQLKEQKEQMAEATIADDNDLVSSNEPLEMATPSEDNEAPMNNPNPQNIPIPSPQNIPPFLSQIILPRTVPTYPLRPHRHQLPRDLSKCWKNRGLNGTWMPTILRWIRL